MIMFCLAINYVPLLTSSPFDVGLADYARGISMPLKGYAPDRNVRVESRPKLLEWSYRSKAAIAAVT